MLPELSPAALDRFWSKVEKSSGCWVWTAGMTCGYGQFKTNRKNHYAHRISFSLKNGPIPDGMLIDHMCHNPACVNPAHLRTVTHKQNMENRAGAHSNSKSGVRGVYWRAKQKKWHAQIRHNGVKIHIGYFGTIKAAEAAAVAMRNDLHTHNSTDRITI